jgi:hypothetical protein
VDYSQKQQSKTVDTQNTDNKEVSVLDKPADSGRETNFSDILELASRDQAPISNIHAYVQDSVNKVLDKIAEHASRALSDQAGHYSVSVTTINIEIEMEEGESIQDVKSTIDGLLSEDGYWGVEKTSQRMFDFAVGIAGDNPAELEKAKAAVTDGFKQVEAMFGGQLPDISYDTYDATISKLDNYIAQVNNSLQTTYA